MGNPEPGAEYGYGLINRASLLGKREAQKVFGAGLGDLSLRDSCTMLADAGKNRVDRDKGYCSLSCINNRGRSTERPDRAIQMKMGVVAVAELAREEESELPLDRVAMAGLERKGEQGRKGSYSQS